MAQTRKAMTDNEYLDSLRADIRVMTSARKDLSRRDTSPQALRALEALDKKIDDTITELSRLRGYAPRLAAAPRKMAATA